jgi:hypothetical protein
MAEESGIGPREEHEISLLSEASVHGTHPVLCAEGTMGYAHSDEAVGGVKLKTQLHLLFFISFFGSH